MRVQIFSGILLYRVVTMVDIISTSGHSAYFSASRNGHIYTQQFSAVRDKSYGLMLFFHKCFVVIT